MSTELKTRTAIVSREDLPETTLPEAITSMLEKEVRQELDLSIDDVVRDLNAALERGIETQHTAAVAEGAKSLGKNIVTVATKLRKRCTGPMDDDKKEVMRRFEAAMYRLVDPLERLSTRLRDKADKIARQQRQEEEDRRQEMRRAAEEARKPSERKRTARFPCLKAATAM
jgi:uncharacterized protein YukE